MTHCERTGKIPYGSAWEAWKVIRVRTSAASRFTHKRRGVPGHVYRCPECRLWHITRAGGHARRPLPAGGPEHD